MESSRLRDDVSVLECSANCWLVFRGLDGVEAQSSLKVVLRVEVVVLELEEVLVREAVIAVERVSIPSE